MNKFLITLFLFLFFSFTIFASGTIDSQDGQLYLAVARYIYYTGQPTAPPYEFNYEGTAKNIHMGTYLGKDGKTTYSPTGLGYSLALLPAVALTDLVYKFYGIPVQIEHFPLESDWLILLTASFTNSLFGAMLGVIMFLYFLEMGLNRRQSLIIVLVTLFATNLWPYTKHSFAHMMFITFLVLTFFLIKKFTKSKKYFFLVLSGVSFGITALTYNQTFTLAIIPLAFYYLLLTKPYIKKPMIREIFGEIGIFILSAAPFLLIFFWFEALRLREWTALPNENFVRQYSVFFKVPISILIEGIYGQLLSPGRSFFIYSPIIFTIIIFWNKIKKAKPELVTFISLSVIYVIFFASLYVVEDPKFGARGLWDGELSWGPRYLLALIPFAMLIVGVIYKNLSKKQIVFIFTPIVLIGLFINFLGIIMPYQIKLSGLENEFIINGQKYTHYSYSNLFARYSPILIQSKNLVHLTRNFSQTINHGDYNVRLYDGIDTPFPVGGQRWRVVDGNGIIKFDQASGNYIHKVTFGLVNHPLKESSNSAAAINFKLNGTDLQPLKLNASEQVEYPITFNPIMLRNKDNELMIDANFENPLTVREKSQILAMMNMRINDTPVNLEALDFPYVSSLSPALTGIKYQTYGSKITDPWKFWEIHTQIYERTPDLWWAKPLFYWDLPKPLFLLLFLGNAIGLLFFGYKTLSKVKS